MRKFFSFITFLSVLLTCFHSSVISKAANSDAVYLDDGYYIITEEIQYSSVLSEITTYSTTTQNASKTSRLYDANDQLIATFTVYGSFSINNGTSVKCTDVTYSQSVSSSKWKFLSATISRNNTSISTASAVGTGMFKNVNTGKQVNISVTLSCSKTGVLS